MILNSITIIYIALPTILKDFGNSKQISWIIISFLLTSTVFGILFGKMSDFCGRKNIFIVAIIIFLCILIN